MKICQKCFNDNVYILKYNQCPGCGLPYNSKKEKSSGFKFGKKNKGWINMGKNGKDTRNL